MSKAHSTNLFLSLYDTDEMGGCIAITATINATNATMCRLVLENKDESPQSSSILDHFIYEEGLLESLPRSFNVVGQQTEKSGSDKIYQLIQYLLDALKEGEGALIIIEDVQDLPLSESDENRFLSLLRRNRKKLLQVILVGKKANVQVLKSPQLKQLYQKLSAKYSASNSRNKEVSKYIEDRLMAVGPTEGTIFLPETLELIRQHSLGIPCIMDLMVTSSPICTFTNQTIERTEEIVRDAVGSLKTKREEIVTISSEKPSIGMVVSNWVRETIRNPALITFLVKVRSRGLLFLKNIKIKKTSLWPINLNLIQKNYIITTIVVVFMCAGAIIFFISKDTNVIDDRSHKPEQKAHGLQGVPENNEASEINEVPVLILEEFDREELDEMPVYLEKKVLLKLAVDHQKKGEFVIARDQYRELVKRFPMDHDIHSNLGSVYMKLGDFNAAIDEYKKVIHIKPNNHKAHNNLGIALYKVGNFQAAINEINSILEANPKDIQSITTLGIISKELGNSDKAERLFEEALSLDYAHEEAHYNLALILEESNVDQAIFHFQKYLEYSSDVNPHLVEEVLGRLDSLHKKQNG